MVQDKQEFLLDSSTIMPTSKPRLLLVLGKGTQGKPATARVVTSPFFDSNVVDAGQEALTLMDENVFDLVLCELDLPDMKAPDLLRELKARSHDLGFVVIGSTTQEAELIAACRNGAAGYVFSTSSAESILFSLDRILTQRNLRIETMRLRHELLERSTAALGALIGASSAMQHVYQLVHRASSSRAPWLIVGETGVGKRVLARHVHASSNRAEGPFVSFRTTGVDDETAFDRLLGPDGCLQRARHGTLLIEHVDRLHPSAQVALLQALEHSDGSARVPSSEDVRIIATTSVDLAREVQGGRFRADLHEYLSTVEANLPPLRERGNDILLLAEHFLAQSAATNLRPAQNFTPRARAKLMAHNWPGNVRALERIVERAVLDTEGTQVDAGVLGFEADSRLPDEPRIPGWTMADIERHAILQTLDSVDGSTARAAQILDLSVRTIQYRLHEYGMAPKKTARRRSRTSNA